MHRAFHWILCLVWLVAAIVLPVSAKGEQEVPLRPYPNMLPSDADRLFADGEFELLSIDPAILTDRQRRRLKGQLFHGYKVLGRVKVPKGSQRDHLVQALREAIANAGYVTVYCFDPRHGIRASLGAHAVDLVICFECDKIQVHSSAMAAFVSTGDSAQPVFDQALKRAGIRWHRGRSSLTWRCS